MNMAKWKKNTEYGDYTQTKDRKNSRTSSQVMIVREAKSLSVCGKHTGSKPISRLLKGIAKAHEALPKKIKDEIIEES